MDILYTVTVTLFLVSITLLAPSAHAQFTGSDARHWCCKVDADEPKPLLLESKIVKYEKQTVAVRTGYAGCGLWGTGRCSLYSARYQSVQKYAVSYRQSPLFQTCPTKHMVCCNQHSLIAGQCLHHDTLNKHIDDIEFLHNLGVLHTGDNKK